MWIDVCRTRTDPRSLAHLRWPCTRWDGRACACAWTDRSSPPCSTACASSWRHVAPNSGTRAAGTAPAAATPPPPPAGPATMGCCSPCLGSGSGSRSASGSSSGRSQAVGQSGSVARGKQAAGGKWRRHAVSLVSLSLSCCWRALSSV